MPCWILPSLNSAILHSAILHKTLTQTNSIWLKVIHSDSTCWWQPSWTLAILHSPILHKKNFHLFILNQPDDGSHLEFCPSLILPSWTSNKLCSFTLTQTWFNLTITHSFSLNLNDGLPSWILPYWIAPILHQTLTQTIWIWLKLNHSHLTWWWQPSSIWPSWIQPC